ncbi:MAG: DUF2726 domain-containing protein [Phycisphaerales bacterium]
MPQTLTVLLIVIGLLVLMGVALVAAAKLGLLKPGESGEKSRPYRLCDRLLSDAELKFHTALTAAMPILCQRANRQDAPLLFAKVRLGDVLTPDRNKTPERSGSDGWQAARNKIDRKHVDFLLCNPATTKPVLVIELDDKSHQRPDRQERDKFLNDACKTAGLPIWRVACLPPNINYDPRQLAAEMAKALGV